MRCKPGLKVSPKAEKQKWYIFVNGIIFSLDFFLYRHCERSRTATNSGSRLCGMAGECGNPLEQLYVFPYLGTFFRMWTASPSMLRSDIFSCHCEFLTQVRNVAISFQFFQIFHPLVFLYLMEIASTSLSRKDSVYQSSL
jgi:hypothetical protein